MKLRYRILILAAIFLVSAFLSYQRIETHTFVNETKTVNVSSPTIPVVSFLVSGCEINKTNGYTFVPEESLLRESLTPVGTGLSFSVLINQEESTIKKVVVATLDVSSSSVIEEKEYKALKDYGDGRLYVNCKLSKNYGTGVEYNLRVTLTTSAGRNIYYYTRLLPTSLTDLSGKLEFAEQFHTDIMDTDGKLSYEQYLEDTDENSGLDYSYVTLTDSIEVIGYGDMNPTEIHENIPTVTEYNSHYISVKLEYWLNIYTNDAMETMYATESMRFFHEGSKNIVYDYTRTMDAEYDGTLVSISRNQLKVGLTTDKDLDYLLSSDSKHLLYSRDTALYEYDMKNNVSICLYSLRSDSDYLRGQNRNHDFKLISVDDEGNADFVVYGYLTQGEYEGRVGILYYRYYADENRLQEMMFVPVTVPYSILKEEFGDFVYMNSYDEFFFILYDTLYQYQTLVNECTVIAEHLSENWVYLKDENTVVYQENYEDKSNTALLYYNLEANTTKRKEAQEGERIVLLGGMNQYVVYGMVNASDITFYDNGSDCVPMYRLVIENPNGTVKKYYEGNENLVESADVSDNIISIKLCTKVDEVTVNEVDEDGKETAVTRPIYEDAGEDILLDAKENASNSITMTYRTTELMHREYYIDLPSSFNLEKVPGTKTTVFTVLTNNTAVSAGSWIDNRYYVCSYGQVIMVSKTMGAALLYADEKCCTVYNSKGITVWKRGTKGKEAKIKNLIKTYAGNGYSKEQAILQMYFDYKGLAVDARNCDLNAKPMLQWLDETIPETVCDLTGATLSEVLAFIYDGRPVIASTGEYYVLITAYTSNTITFVDLELGQTRTIGITRAKEIFDKTGIYYSYVE